MVSDVSIERADAIRRTILAAVDKTVEQLGPLEEHLHGDELRMQIIASTAASLALTEWFKLWKEPV